jgi:hypothetical protein
MGGSQSEAPMMHFQPRPVGIKRKAKKTKTAEEDFKIESWKKTNSKKTLKNITLSDR